jgi:hypothetical protein
MRSLAPRKYVQRREALCGESNNEVYLQRI